MQAVLLPAASLQRPAGRCCRCTPSTGCRTLMVLHAREYHGLRNPQSTMCHSRTSCWTRYVLLKSCSWQAGKRRLSAWCHFLFLSVPATQPCFGTAGRAQRMTRRGSICGRSSAAFNCCGQVAVRADRRRHSTTEASFQLVQVHAPSKHILSVVHHFCTGSSVCAVACSRVVVRFVTWVQLAGCAS